MNLLGIPIFSSERLFGENIKPKTMRGESSCENLPLLSNTYHGDQVAEIIVDEENDIEFKFNIGVPPVSFLGTILWLLVTDRLLRIGCGDIIYYGDRIEKEISWRLNGEATVFLAEAQGIQNTIMDTLDFQGTINIYTDSRSSLQSLNSPWSHCDIYMKLKSGF
ncbi:hypothetical protein AVEN_219139-1 [Araneus ventricosus]|uniref:RNase H type-1 domain-containing protein n=1 Tax=Araneus ventricosus TaxID=182803 RepID=A0A4Y2FQ48_ARAVE|nr:hypothetical protein AVEN_219139-1 [Araneus ventricosus]